MTFRTFWLNTCKEEKAMPSRTFPRSFWPPFPRYLVSLFLQSILTLSMSLLLLLLLLLVILSSSWFPFPHISQLLLPHCPLPFTNFSLWQHFFYQKMKPPPTSVALLGALKDSAAAPPSLVASRPQTAATGGESAGLELRSRLVRESEGASSARECSYRWGGGIGVKGVKIEKDFGGFLTINVPKCAIFFYLAWYADQFMIMIIILM